MLDETNSVKRATALLKGMRETPMLRGGKAAFGKEQLRGKIAAAIAAQGVLPRLAERIAFQFVLKFDIGKIGDDAVWRVVGQRLHRETDQLRSEIVSWIAKSSSRSRSCQRIRSRSFFESSKE
jgi:hypothetical protein